MKYKTSWQGGTRGVENPPKICNDTIMNKTTDMTITVTNPEGKKYISLVQDSAFIDAIQGMQEFVLVTDADIDMAYDWVCDQAECSSFVADGPAWDLFYEMWETTQNLDLD